MSDEAELAEFAANNGNTGITGIVGEMPKPDLKLSKTTKGLLAFAVVSWSALIAVTKIEKVRQALTKRRKVTREDFDEILGRQLKLVQDVFEKKTEEYATQDQLHNFRKSSELQGIPVPEAVLGMMSKHTVSLLTMS